FLRLVPQAYKLGLCFDFQKVASVPTEDTDVRMDEII
ncbi:MAG: 5-formyltetrahydrofolate cyclo-ligase, partial [Segatella oris]